MVNVSCIKCLQCKHVSRIEYIPLKEKNSNIRTIRAFLFFYYSMIIFMQNNVDLEKSYVGCK